MKIVITGGCGFIGSNFIRYLIEKYPSYKILNIDKLTYAGNLENLKDIEKNPNYKFLKKDICDKDIEEFIDDYDVILNFAAESIPEYIFCPIWTAMGIRIYSFGELFKNLSKKNKVKKYPDGVEVIELKHKNIKALSYRGGIGYWMPIKQISRHWYKGKIIRLTQKWGEIEVTPNHSIYDIDFNLTTPKNNPELLGLRNINHICKKKSYKFYSGDKLKALLTIMGGYISEGWSIYNKNNGCYQIGISSKNKEWINNIKESFKELGYNPSITFTKDKVYQLMISNKNFFKFIRKECGFGHENKKIPDFIFNLNENYQKIFLENLIKGDGEVIKNKNYKTIRYVTTSKRLATGLSLLLTLLKYNYSVIKDKRFNAYSINFGGDYTISLCSKTYEEIDYEGYVYDLSIENLKNFVCGIGNIVVHNTHVDRSIYQPDIFLKTDIFGTFNLLQIAKKKNIRFIQISTDEVYGSIEDGSFDENSNLNPSNPYSASKASADLLTLSFFKTYKVPVNIIRSCNNYGPYQYPEKFIPLMITNAIENKKLPIYGDGLYKREWIFVIDNCEAIDIILHKGEAGEIYNVSSEFSIPNIEIAKKILKYMGKSEDLIEFVKDRPGHDRRYSIKCEKIKKLGWYPQTDFEKGLSFTIEWYIKNENWWRKIKQNQSFISHLQKTYK